jgi:hypothetical protein
MPSPSQVLDGLFDLKPQGPPTIELWDAWVFAEIDCEMALKRWWDSHGAERASAFAAYTAALEREAQAAGALETRLTVTGAVTGSS